MLLAVDSGDVVQVIWVSLAAGVGITLMFSLVVVGGGRSAEARRTGHNGIATGFAVLATLAFVIFAAGVAYGVHIMLSKS
jgi:hypothetical protein